MPEPEKKHSQCPYWSSKEIIEASECLLTKGGLYIPMPRHIEVFCGTAQYSKCNHYIRSCDLFNETAKKLGILLDDDRRRYLRVMREYTLSLMTGVDSIQKDDAVDVRALTIDMSLGGMRIRSEEALAANQTVSFAFGSDFMDKTHPGIGEVKWCRPSGDNDGFLAGMSFVFLDPRMRQAIGNHIGLPLM